MWRALPLVCLVIGLSIPPALAADPPVCGILHDGGEVSWSAMLAEISKADVVFIGEQHDHVAGHVLQYHILKGMIERRHHVSLSLEMFERDTQGVVDEYLTGLITESAFLAASRPWPNYKRDYRPMVELCRDAKLAVVAANIPRRYVNMVSRGGQETLSKLTKGSRRWLPRLPYSLEIPAEYGAALDEMFALPHGQDPAPGMPTPANMRQAQTLWDIGMAESILNARKHRSRPAVVHMCGSMHSDHHWGAVAQLSKRNPSIKVVTISIKPDAGYPAVSSVAYTGVADFMILTPPDPAAPTEPAQAK